MQNDLINPPSPAPEPSADVQASPQTTPFNSFTQSHTAVTPTESMVAETPRHDSSPMPAWLSSSADNGASNTGNDAPALAAPADDRPVPVVKVLSVRGMEYLFMTLALYFGTASLVTILLAAVNSSASFDLLAFPLSLLIVSLPIFAFFFLRLRKAELANPELRLEASKRRLSQITQIFSFLITVFTIVGLLNVVFASIGGEYGGSLGKAFLNALVILVFSLGILLYYWFDEHKLVK